jgi:hypothetical protein
MIGLDFDLAPDEQIKYLESKGYRLTYHYKELMREAHHTAFTVAKVTSLDLLYDIRKSLTEAQSKGLGFTDWLNSGIKDDLKRHGWYGKTDVTDPRTGETTTINVGRRRLKTIYMTNDRVAYMVARYQELREDELAPYWVYKSALLENTRASHAALHNRVYHRDSPFWDTWYPPNAWNCQCYVLSMTSAEAKGGGYKLDQPFSPNDDPSWSYKVGATDQIAGVIDSAYSKAIKDLRDTQLGEWGQTWQRDHVEKVLVAARQSVDTEGYREWVKSFYDDKRQRKAIDINRDNPVVKMVGAMDIRVFDYFAKQGKTPLSAVLTLSDIKIDHATREDKKGRGAAFSMRRMLRAPEMIANPKAILWDESKKNVLYIYDAEGEKIKDRRLKLVLEVNYQLVEDKSSDKYNTIVTAGIVEAGNLKDPRYTLISGKLD